MAKAPKYTNDEERRVAIAAKMRANWRRPEMRAAWKSSMKAAARARREDCLSDETLAQFLREYCEPDPTKQRPYRFTLAQLGLRYLISPTYAAHLASNHGVKRRKRMKKLGPSKIKTIVYRYVELGHSVLALSLEMGVSKAAISYRLKTNGINASMRGIGTAPERAAA